MLIVLFFHQRRTGWHSENTTIKTLEYGVQKEVRVGRRWGRGVVTRYRRPPLPEELQHRGEEYIYT
jgi:hypothetical protein